MSSAKVVIHVVKESSDAFVPPSLSRELSPPFRSITMYGITICYTVAELLGDDDPPNDSH